MNERAENQKLSGNGFPWAKAAGLVLVLAVLLALIFFVPVRGAMVGVIEALEDFGIWGLAVLGLLYVVACVLVLPGSPLTLGVGFLAAILWPERFWVAVAVGTATVSAASVAGATAAFLLGRTIARGVVRRRIEGNAKFEALDRAVGENGFKIVFLVRLSPAFPFNVLNYVLGLTAVRLRDFLIASWAGMLPGTVLFVYVGTTLSSLAALISGELPRGGGHTALLLAGLAATLILVVVVTRLARKALREAMEGRDG